VTDPRYATPKARLPHLSEIFDGIEEWTKTKTKFEAMDVLNGHDIPCGPILSMKEIAEEPSLRKTGTVVEVEHPTRGTYLTVGNPIKMSDSPSDVKRSPLLGEHTEEILTKVLGYNKKEVDRCIENWMSTNTYVTHNPDDRYPLPDLTGVPLEHTWWSAENRAGSIESDIHIDNSLMAHPFFHRHGEPNRNKITRAEAEMLMEQRGDAVCDVCHPPPK